MPARFSASSRSSSCTSSTGDRPNFDFSPPLLAQRPDPSVDELDADADARLGLHLVGHLEQHVELVELLDDDDDLVAQLLAHEGQAHELLVLVAVADDEVVAGLAQAQHGLQLRLAAALEPDAELLPELDDLLHHVALLVHLDRVDRGVAPFVAELLDRVGEMPREGRDARPQDVGEAEQERETRRPAH